MPRPVSVSLAALAAVLSFSAAPAAVPPAGPGPAAETLLLRAPTIGGGRIVFAHAGDLWSVGLAGGDARRLTAGDGAASDPHLSPDGAWLAYTLRRDGNADVYVMSAAGGTSRRLTWHPGDDLVRGWSPDGAKVLFASPRDAANDRCDQLFLVPRDGGWPTPLPPPMAERGAISADGRLLAYTPLHDGFWTWKRYRGGMTTPVRIYDLAARTTAEAPHENASDTFPTWLGGKLYFLSDRAGTMNVFVYDPATRAVRRLTDHADYDVRSLAAGDGLLVYEQAGRIHLLDPATGVSRAVAVRVVGELPALAPRLAAAAQSIESFGISPTGARALFAARGEIFTVPAERGAPRDVSRTPGAHERYPAWSPDGQRIAYLSDASGEYRLHVRDQAGLEPPLVVDLGPGNFFYEPRWSPDGRRIALTDKRLNVWIVDLAEKRGAVVDTDTYESPERSLDPDWSPDGRYLAYTKRLKNHLRAVFVHDIVTGAKRQVTDGARDAVSARFSADGKYLYFAASANYGLNAGWLEMSSFERPVRRALQLAILAADEPSPVGLESDEEPPAAVGSLADKRPAAAKAKTRHKRPAPKKPAAPARPGETRIDFDGIGGRIVALPLPEGDYRTLRPGVGETLFYLEGGDLQGGGALHRFDLATREDKVVFDNVAEFDLAFDGNRLIFRGKEDAYFVADADAAPDAEPLPLKLEGMVAPIDPREEWREIFDEAWRQWRDFFYDPGLHGVDWNAAREKYRVFLPHVAHRCDLTYLLSEMGGELVAGHVFVDDPPPETAPGPRVGLLGADVEPDGGFYRIARILRRRAAEGDAPPPLAAPGLGVREGDYIVAVDGRPVSTGDELFRWLDGAAGRPTLLTVNDRPSAAGARTVEILPIEDETSLRRRARVEAARARVAELSNGRLGYVDLPDTGTLGYDAFNRDYFSQADKDGLIVDDRFNSGGAVADYILDLLGRAPLAWWATREGAVFSSPAAAVFGPRVMLINEYSSSGGDALAQFFRRRGLGPLVGRRTWGGLVGVLDDPPLLDGGAVSAPGVAVFSPEGRWEVENEGVAPDVDVAETPQDAAAGRDPQLEKAVELALRALAAAPPRPARPPYPVKRQTR